MKVHDYHQGNLQLQDKFGTRKLAERLANRATETLESGQREMIESANMFFLATCDERGLPTVSYKGGTPGLYGSSMIRPSLSLTMTEMVNTSLWGTCCRTPMLVSCLSILRAS
ncbi:MAG: hypothetical protein Ct9H300mP11_15570 [Chloroflexota bacterium]|nr:MAG: hypothetical protein Ct9H300mP11_15570 [Chloroflexota bacterium]